MKHSALVVAALVAGFAGGLLGSLVIQRREAGPVGIIRARRFELVSQEGKVISFWGIDKGQNAVLAFGSYWPGPPPPGRPRWLNPDNPEEQRLAIGVVDDLPFMHQSGADGKTRVRLYLSLDGKPMLLMEDETGPRLSLGIVQSDAPSPEDNDWALIFNPERAVIGMITRKENGQMYVRGTFDVHRESVKYP